MMTNAEDPQEQLLIEEITSPIEAQIFDFCESELFQETLQNSEVASSSNNCCYEEHSSHPPNLSITVDMNKYSTAADTGAAIKPPVAAAATSGTTTALSTPTAVATRNTNLSVFLDDPINDTDLSAGPVDFTAGPSPISFSIPNHYFNNNNQEIFGMNNQVSLGVDAAADGGPSSIYDAAHKYNPPERRPIVAPQPPPALGPPAAALPTGYEEECLPNSAAPYIRLRNSPGGCTLSVDHLIGHYLSGAPFSADNSSFFTGNLFSGSDLTRQELDFQGDNGGLFLPNSVAKVFNCSSGDLQALSSESQHLLSGSPSTTLASDISSLEDPTFKVGKLSAEERKRKINRYMKKRNERNFSKKIKYACRKTLADSRPRVRGRFAKNDELGEIARNAATNHEDDTDEDVSLFSNQMPNKQHKVEKGEEEVEASDIFAHISGVNSFKCNYPIQSWI